MASAEENTLFNLRCWWRGLTLGTKIYLVVHPDFAAPINENVRAHARIYILLRGNNLFPRYKSSDRCISIRSNKLLPRRVIYITAYGCYYCCWLLLLTSYCWLLLLTSYCWLLLLTSYCWPIPVTVEMCPAPALCIRLRRLHGPLRGNGVAALLKCGLRPHKYITDANANQQLGNDVLLFISILILVISILNLHLRLSFYICIPFDISILHFIFPFDICIFILISQLHLYS